MWLEGSESSDGHSDTFDEVTKASTRTILIRMGIKHQKKEKRGRAENSKLKYLWTSVNCCSRCMRLPANDAHENCDDDNEPGERDLPCSCSVAMTSLMPFSSASSSFSLWRIGREVDQACVLSRIDSSFSDNSASYE